MNSTEAQIATIQDYARQLQKLETDLHRVLVELNRNLARLPVAEIVNAADLQHRERELAKREREMQDRWRRAEALLEGE